MFIAAALQKYDKKFGVKSIFSKKILFENKALDESGLPFVLVKLKNPNLINSAKAVAAIGKNRVILSRDISNICVRPYNLTSNYEYEQILMKKGLALLLDGLKLNILKAKAKNCTAVLIDIQSRHQEIADILLRSFKTIKIITAETGFYKDYAASKLYECGAAVILQNKPGALENTDLFVSPDGVLYEEMLKSTVPIIARTACVKPLYSKAPIISAFRATVPEEYDEIISMNFDSHEFLAALYRYCGIRNRQILLPSYAQINGVYKSLNEINLFSIDSQ